MSSAKNTPRVHQWHHLTAPEICLLAKRAVTILPLGSTEQHGRHLVTGTDTFLNELLQTGLRDTPPPEGEFLILPTLPLGTSEHHVAFGGTLTIPPILYTQVLVAMLRSLILQGHKRIFMLNSHGGNHAPMMTALAEMSVECTEKEVLLGGANYWTLCDPFWRKEVIGLKFPHVAHACEIETSLMMVARPDLPTRSKPDEVPFSRLLGEGWGIAGAFNAFTAEGHTGCPAEASAEKGMALFKVAVRVLGNFLADYSKLPPVSDVRSAGNHKL